MWTSVAGERGQNSGRAGIKGAVNLMRNNNRRGNVDEISTWTKHKQRLCLKCRANCCTMPVEVKIPDLVRMGVIKGIEADEPIKKLAKKLKKNGVIEHLYFKEQIFMLVRFANNDCLYLDPTSRKYKIY